eukprot:m.57850 g.57850  ORF g.57850 m.57850 type:complete len:409 (+) comp7106_c0_seq2:326-1552(+)
MRQHQTPDVRDWRSLGQARVAGRLVQHLPILHRCLPPALWHQLDRRALCCYPQSSRPCVGVRHNCPTGLVQLRQGRLLGPRVWRSRCHPEHQLAARHRHPRQPRCPVWHDLVGPQLACAHQLGREQSVRQRWRSLRAPRPKSGILLADQPNRVRSGQPCWQEWSADARCCGCQHWLLQRHRGPAQWPLLCPWPLDCCARGQRRRKQDWLRDLGRHVAPPGYRHLFWKRRCHGYYYLFTSLSCGRHQGHVKAHHQELKRWALSRAPTSRAVLGELRWHGWPLQSFPGSLDKHVLCDQPVQRLRGRRSFGPARFSPRLSNSNPDVLRRESPPLHCQLNPWSLGCYPCDEPRQSPSCLWYHREHQPHQHRLCPCHLPACFASRDNVLWHRLRHHHLDPANKRPPGPYDDPG